MNFVSCSVETCPLNTSRQCRAPFLMVDISGNCVIKDKGPHDNKSTTEKYVDIKECNCKKCYYWERNEFTGLGKCGNNDPLHFEKRDEKAKCKAIDSQIDEPPAFPNIVR